MHSKTVSDVIAARCILRFAVPGFHAESGYAKACSPLVQCNAARNTGPGHAETSMHFHAILVQMYSAQTALLVALTIRALAYLQHDVTARYPKGAMVVVIA